MGQWFDNQLNYPSCSELIYQQDFYAATKEPPLIFAEPVFEIFPGIAEQLAQRAAGNYYGSIVADETYQSAVQNWLQLRHSWTIDTDWLVPTTGTIAGIATAIAAFSKAGDGIIIQTPVFHVYREQIEYLERTVRGNDLVRTPTGYEINFVELEQLMQEDTTTMMILCHPHNPTGKVYTAAELTQILTLAEKYGVLLLADEIFADVVYPEIPFVSLGNTDHPSKNWLVFHSLGKSFGMSGINHANAIIENPSLRATFAYHLLQRRLGKLDLFSREIVVAAYQSGHEWLNQMVAYIQENQQWVTQFTEKLAIQCIPAEYAYFAWLDFTALGKNEAELQLLFEQASFFATSGSKYGQAGTGFLRVNLAVPRSVLVGAFERLASVIEIR